MDSDSNPSVLNTTVLSGGVTEITFGGVAPLEEFSDYLFSITAMNGVGSSPPRLMTVRTLPLGMEIDFVM